MHKSKNINNHTKAYNNQIAKKTERKRKNWKGDRENPLIIQRSKDNNDHKLVM